MEQLKLKTAMVVGTAVPEAWGQAYVGTMGEGQVVAVVSLSYAGEGDLLDLAEVGGSVLANLREKHNLQKEDIAGLSEELSLSVILVTRKDNLLEICGIGEGEVYLLREGKLGRIFEGGETIETIKGVVQKGDMLLVVTKELGEKIEGGKMRKIMEGGVEEIDNLAVLVRGSQDSSRMVGVMGKAEEVEQVEPVNNNHQTRINNLDERLKKFKERIKRGKPLKIRGERKSGNLWVGIAILILLVLGVGGGVVKKSRIVKERVYAELIASVEQKMEEAKSVGDLNPARARDLLTQARMEKDNYLKKTDDENYRVKVDELGKKIEATEIEVFHKQQVETKTFVELSVMSQDFTASTMMLGENGNLLLPDETKARVLGINLRDQSIIKVNLGEMGRMREIGEYNKKIYGLVEGGVGMATEQETKVKIVIEPDDLWGEITQIGLYAGNIYLLDKKQGEIWKYPVLSEGFGSRRRWLATGIAPDLSKVVKMKVEGDIWILTESGKLLRYSRGVPVSFAMEGFPTEQAGKLIEPRAMFVTESEVYVLEAGAKRVVVFGVEGKYKRQYSADIFGEGKDLVVEGEKGYVLMSDKIVWFGL